MLIIHIKCYGQSNTPLLWNLNSVVQIYTYRVYISVEWTNCRYQDTRWRHCQPCGIHCDTCSLCAFLPVRVMSSDGQIHPQWLEETIRLELYLVLKTFTAVIITDYMCTIIYLCLFDICFECKNRCSYIWDTVHRHRVDSLFFHRRAGSFVEWSVFLLHTDVLLHYKRNRLINSIALQTHDESDPVCHFPNLIIYTMF